MDVLRSILCGHGACEDGVERKVKMKAADLRQRFARGVNQKVRFGLYASVAAASFLVARAWAGPASEGTATKAEVISEEAAVRVSPNYALEDRFLPDQVSKLVFDLAVTPHWFSESDRFWYSYQTTEGTRYYMVDPVKKSKTPLWDNAKVAAALSTMTNFPYDAQHLPIKRLKLVEKDTRMRFEVEIRKNAVVPNEPKKEKSQEDIEEQGKEGETKQGEQQGQATQATGQPAEKPEDTRTIYFEYDMATGKVTRLDNFEAPKKKPMWAALSPDGKTVVFARGFNLYQMDGENYSKALKKAGDASAVETQVTTDGVEKYSYARVLLPEQEEQLKKIDKGDTNKAGPRTPAVTIHWSKDSKKFALEREDNRKVGDYWVIHSLANPRPILEARSYPLPGEANMPVSEIDIFDVASKQRAVVQPKNFVDEVLTISDAPQMERDREELREEQDGWGHVYLYDGQGKLKNQITSGEYMTDQIAAVDEKTRTLYFTANGREAGEDPYYTHLYRVGLDGSGLKFLTRGNFTHAVSWPDSGKYFEDTYSRVDTAPKSVLLDGQGTQLAELETTDVSQLMEAGFKYPETFKVKADDGVTDLYGVIYKPFDFDASRKYPVIEYVYPGPQVEQVTKALSPKSPNVPLAQLGFVVMEVGNRGGSPQRDKWYDSFGYGNLRDYGLADMKGAAMLQYPEFYKAGWSESGNHDNNVYGNTWSEKYHGVREETQKDGTQKFFYEIDKNSEIAKNLKGHLMLTTGDMDDNVSMVNTMRVADALIKANKRFEMLVFPGMRHSYMPINSYVIVARGDFF